MRVENRPTAKSGVRRRDKLASLLPTGMRSAHVDDVERPFSEVLVNLSGASLNEELESFLGKLDAQAELIVKSRRLEEVARYRDLVSQFVGALVSRAYAAEEHAGFDRRGRHRLFVLVRRIDEELEKLVRLVLDRQAGSIDILAKLGEIRGLVVDLYT